MPKTIKSQLRKVIYNINNYLSERRSEGIDSIPLNNITDLVVNMTGISRSSVMKIRREGQTSVVFSTPKKNKPKTKKKINLGDFDLCAIRHKLQEFYAVRKEVPSLKRLLAALKESINFIGGRESLRLLLHKLGYKFKKCRNQRTILMEWYDIVAWRDRYLQEIKDVRKSGMPIVYLDESYIHTSLNHAKCWQSENESADTWNNCCEHTKKIEEDYRQRGPVIDGEIEKFIINVGDDSETSSDTSSNESVISEIETQQSDNEDHETYESVEYLDSDVEDLCY